MIEKDIAEKWLKEDYPKVTYFLDRDVEVILKPNWVISRYSWLYNKISIGLANLKNRDEFRKMIVHEYLHKKGIHHSRKARILGFYSIKTKDTLSEKVRDWIFYGKPKPVELEILLRGD